MLGIRKHAKSLTRSRFPQVYVPPETFNDIHVNSFHRPPDANDFRAIFSSAGPSHDPISPPFVMLSVAVAEGDDRDVS